MRQISKKKYCFERKKNNSSLQMSDKLLLLFVVIVLIGWLWFRSFVNNGNAQPTMERLFEVAMQPIGSTMYIWGGGWQNDDEESGIGLTRIGVSPTWEEFAKKQDATYNYEEYRYKSELGLDCSGYVGWVIYNLFETEDGKEGYVTLSTEMAENFASRGWGTLYKNPKQFLAGDIVSMDGHVWICLGTCDDGSVLLVHSSPPGVSICGTETSSKETTSIAVQLAERFMETYYEKWQSMYPKRTVSQTYLEDVTVMRWNEKTIADAKTYQNMSGEEVMEILEGNYK